MSALSLEEARIGRSVARRWRSTPRGPLDAGRGVHDAIEVTWVVEGAIAVSWSGREHVVNPGQVVVIPPGQPHRTRFLAPSVAGSLKLEAGALEDDRSVVGTIDDPGAAARVITLGELLYDEARRNDDGAPRVVAALSDALAVELTRLGTPRASPVPPVLRAMLDLFEDELGEPLRVEHVAQRLGLSRFQLARLAREHLGKSTHELLDERRLARARDLLARTRLSVAAVAMAVGYRDPGRFARTFRRRYGELPADFRRTIIAGTARGVRRPMH